MEAVRASYGRGVTDEFIEPMSIRGGRGCMPELDAAIFFNFRPIARASSRSACSSTASI